MGVQVPLPGRPGLIGECSCVPASLEIVVTSSSRPSLANARQPVSTTEGITDASSPAANDPA